jgi:hypothetical protein
MNMYIEREQSILELVREALAENERKGGKFDPDSFANFFIEDESEKVREAWKIYAQVVNGGMKL